MPRVIDNIHVVTDRFVNVYLLIRRGGLILVDTGLDTTWMLIKDYLGDLGFGLRDLAVIIVTHHHWDHTGSLRVLRGESNARIFAHRDEAQLIEDSTGVGVDEVVEDGAVVNELTVIHTPGHTPGHIALLDKETQSLFTGDLVYEENGELYEIPHRYSRDPMENRRSIVKLLDYEFKNILPSHGKPILGEGREKLEELVERFKAY